MECWRVGEQCEQNGVLEGWVRVGGGKPVPVRAVTRETGS